VYSLNTSCVFKLFRGCESSLDVSHVLEWLQKVATGEPLEAPENENEKVSGPEHHRARPGEIGILWPNNQRRHRTLHI